MSRIDIFYTALCLGTQTMSPTLPGFQYIKMCIQYIYNHTHKPILYPSDSYDGSSYIRLIWSRNQVQYYTTQNCL